GLAAMHDTRRPWPVVIEGPGRLYGEAAVIAVAVERERTLLPPLFAPYHNGLAAGRHVAGRNDHRCTTAIFLEHPMPSPRPLSLTSRPSASAASHSRVANVSLPVRWKASLPFAPRTAKVRPSAATSTSGTCVRAASTSASTPKAAPLQRSGVLRSPMTRRPAVASRRGPVPNDVTRPKAPGRPATHKATVSIHSMP